MNKNIIPIIVFLLLVTITYAENACSKDVCLQNIENVGQKVTQLRDLSIGRIGYKGLHDGSLDVSVGIRALYEEATLYKELAQLRSEYETIPKVELKEKVAVPISKSETTDKKTEQKPKKEVTQEIHKSKVITIDASRWNPFINEVLIYFSADSDGASWFWCMRPYIGNCKEFKKVTKESPVKGKINDESYELVSGLEKKNFDEGLDILLMRLISLKLSGNSLRLEIEGVGDVSPELRKINIEKGGITQEVITQEVNTIDLKIGEDLYNYVAEQSPGEDIEYPQEGDYEKALNKLKEILENKK